MAYELFPGIDETFSFPPVVRVALSESVELRNMIVPMTQVERNNLPAAAKWNGRTILNLDEMAPEVWSSVDNEWFSVGATLAELNAGLETRVAKAGDDMTGDLGLYTYKERRKAASVSAWNVSLKAESVHRNSYAGPVVISFSDLPTIATELRSVTLIFEPTVTGLTWPANTRFANGVAPVMSVSGELWVSVVVEGNGANPALVSVFPISYSVKVPS